MNELKEFKSRQNGSTLLEILVSVFVLGFGLLALVTMQMKTVMTTREAENQTIVAQAADSLIESMLMNPNLKLETLADGDKVMYRQFNDYRGLSGLTSACKQDGILTSAAAASSGITKKQLAEAHACTFVKRISQIPNTSKVYWDICLEDAATVNKPELNGNVVKCNGSATSTSTVLKVIWEQEIEDSSRYVNSGLTLNSAGTAVLYSYQAPISQ